MTMPRLPEAEATAARGDGAVSSIVSRLIAKGGCLLNTKALRRLRDLESLIAELDELVAVHDALGAAAALRPQRARLELPLQTVKPTLSRAEEVLDKVVESHRQMLSLPEDTNPFFKRSLPGKLQAKFSGVFHHANGAAPAPDMTTLKHRVHKVEGLVDKADMQLGASPRPDMKGVGRHPPPKVIGRDAECRSIVAALHGERHEEGEEEVDYSGRPYSVMGIHGAAGSGKTTLAQSAYARAQAQEDENPYFDRFMWLQLRRHFSPQEVANDLMHQAVGLNELMKAAKGRGDDADVAPLLRRVQDELRGKRLLLVLDDVRCDGNSSGADLKQILSPLLDVVKAGSKVLITARSVDALLVLGAARSDCVPIRELDDDVFLRLFMHYALGEDGVDDRDRGILEVIGADIATKLKRSPLAARLVGKELRATRQIEFWRTVRDTI
ncbi:unnamed protein product [Alopecurus aequalis]